jgi:hypothetical protein
MARSVGLILALALAGCQTVADAGPPATPAPGQASLTIARSSNPLYLAAAASVDVNGVNFASLPVGGSHTGAIAPGPTVITASAWSAPGRYSIRFNAEPGKSYRVVVTPRGAPMLAGMAGGIVGQVVEGGGPFQVALAR